MIKNLNIRISISLMNLISLKYALNKIALFMILNVELFIVIYWSRFSRRRIMFI